MKVQTLTILAQKLRDRLLPTLMGSVFHITCRTSYQGILNVGAIQNNRDNRFAYSVPQSVNSYGRKRGYVCLFDLRHVPDEELDLALDKFYLLNPHYCDGNPIFLVLDEAFHADLILWKAGNICEMRIPHVESWYPGDIEIRKVRRVIDVRVH
jgi:hypothetical protein